MPSTSLALGLLHLSLQVKGPQPCRLRRPGVPLARTAQVLKYHALLVLAVALLLPVPSPAEQVAVRQTEGLVHGFLVLRDTAGTSLADGELLQVAKGDLVTSRLVFHFKDGSLLD